MGSHYSKFSLSMPSHLSLKLLLCCRLSDVSDLKSAAYFYRGAHSSSERPANERARTVIPSLSLRLLVCWAESSSCFLLYCAVRDRAAQLGRLLTAAAASTDSSDVA